MGCPQSAAPAPTDRIDHRVIALRKYPRQTLRSSRRRHPVLTARPGGIHSPSGISAASSQSGVHGRLGTSTQPREAATPTIKVVAGHKTARNGSAPTSPRSSARPAKTCRHGASIPASTRENTATRSAGLPRCSEVRASPFPVAGPRPAVDRAMPDPIPTDLPSGDMDMAGLDASAQECGAAPPGSGS
jgi:hypothetical protein